MERTFKLELARVHQLPNRTVSVDLTGDIDSTHVHMDPRIVATMMLEGFPQRHCWIPGEVTPISESTPGPGSHWAYFAYGSGNTNHGTVSIWNEVRWAYENGQSKQFILPAPECPDVEPISDLAMYERLSHLERGQSLRAWGLVKAPYRPNDMPRWNYLSFNCEMYSSQLSAMFASAYLLNNPTHRRSARADEMKERLKKSRRRTFGFPYGNAKELRELWALRRYALLARIWYEG